MASANLTGSTFKIHPGFTHVQPPSLPPLSLKPPLPLMYCNGSNWLPNTAEIVALTKYKHSMDSTAFANPLAARMSHVLANAIWAEVTYHFWAKAISNLQVSLSSLPFFPNHGSSGGYRSQMTQQKMVALPSAWILSDIVV